MMQILRKIGLFSYIFMKNKNVDNRRQISPNPSFPRAELAWTGSLTPTLKEFIDPFRQRGSWKTNSKIEKKIVYHFLKFYKIENLLRRKNVWGKRWGVCKNGALPFGRRTAKRNRQEKLMQPQFQAYR